MKKTLLTVAIVILFVASLLGYGIYWIFFDIQHIEGQKVIRETTSPDGTYTITAYLNNGGATTDYAVLCSVKTNRTGREKNIYWQYHCSTAFIFWIDEDTVQINGVELNVKNDIYDYRWN